MLLADLELALHLRDTRGMGIANAYAGLELSITRFDAAVAGLGGCPFAGHAGAAGNVCTEDLVFIAMRWASRPASTSNLRGGDYDRLPKEMVSARSELKWREVIATLPPTKRSLASKDHAQEAVG